MKMKIKMFASFGAVCISIIGINSARAQAPAPSVADTNLAVRTVISNLSQFVMMVFLGSDDFFVTEKASGQVKHVVDGVVVSIVFQLLVNLVSEHKLLKIT